MLTIVMVISVMQASVTFAGESQQKAELLINISGSGSVTVSDGNDSKIAKTNFSSSYPIGDAIMLDIKADKGNQIKSVTANGEETDDLTEGATEYSCSYVVDGSRVSIQVTFEKQKDNVTNDTEKKTDTTTNNTFVDETVTHGEDGNTDSEIQEPEELKNPDTNIIPEQNPKTTWTLYRNDDSQGIVAPLNVDTGSFKIATYGDSYNYCPLGSGSNLKVQLKYIWNDWYANSDFTVDGSNNARMVYCLQWQAKTPSASSWDGKDSISKEIVYCLTYGVQYWGKTSEYSKYSTGNWIKDYCATQLAVHACNKEFGGGIEYNRNYIYNHINDADVKSVFNKLVQDAMEAGNYDVFSGNQWTGYGYSITPTSSSGWSSYTKDGKAGYITTTHYAQNLKANKWINTNMPWYITDKSGNTSGVNGAEVVWDSTNNYSSFRIWVPKASYEAAQNTGATITANISCKVPAGMTAWKYTPAESGYQVTTVFEYASMKSITTPVTATIAKEVENGDLKITKSSSNEVLVKDNNNYSLQNAEFTVYKKGTDTVVATLKTNANGVATGTLTAGTYDVVETKAPKGYILDGTKHEVTITSGGTTNLAVKDAPKTGKINLIKSSSKPEYTDGNDMYSLKDAVYTVYKKGTKTEVGKITTDKDGKGSLSGLAIGSYDVQETTAPKGFALDTDVHSVTINETTASTVTIDLKVTDTVQLDPVGVLLKKVDAETMEAVPTGTASLAGAEFTIKYYAVENYTTDPAADGKEALRTWVVKTNENGYTRLSQAYLVSGSEFYLDPTGTPSLPLGTITIQETKAPEGYRLNNDIFVVPITADGSGNSVNTYAIPTVPENALTMNLKKVQSGTDKVITGAVFEHTKPDGTKETLTTDKNGELTFTGLTWGTHTVKEISVPDGYSVNTDEIKFTVAEGNVITIDSKSTETDTNGKISVTVNAEGNIDAVVEEKPAPYKLKVVKYNDNGKVLPDAEFTLYAERECNTVVSKNTTDANGILTLENLIPGKHYYLKETKAPQGYKLPESGNLYDIYVESIPVDGVFDFTVNGENFTTDNTDTTQNIYLSGSKADRVINMKIVNKIGLLLPETGSNMTIIVIAVGVVLMLFGLAFNKEKKNKKKKVEEQEV